jgi:hypothetical protein
VDQIGPLERYGGTNFHFYKLVSRLYRSEQLLYHEGQQSTSLSATLFTKLGKLEKQLFGQEFFRPGYSRTKKATRSMPWWHNKRIGWDQMEPNKCLSQRLCSQSISHKLSCFLTHPAHSSSLYVCKGWRTDGLWDFGPGWLQSSLLRLEIEDGGTLRTMTKVWDWRGRGKLRIFFQEKDRRIKNKQNINNITTMASARHRSQCRPMVQRPLSPQHQP